MNVRRDRWKAAARDLLILAIAVGMGVAIYLERSPIADGLRNTRSLNWAWVAASSVIEVLSMVAFALLYRDLLRANGSRLTLTWILAGSYTANAICLAIPVIGSGMASRQMYRWFRQGGADPAATSLTLTVAGIVSTVTLATVVTTGALLSGNPAAGVGGALAAIGLLGVATALAVELHTERGRTRLLGMTTAFISCSQRIIKRPRGESRAIAESVLASLQQMRLNVSALARLLLWGLLNWWADVACWIFATLAANITGLSVGKSLLVWTAGAGAASFSPTPAGIGAVEVAMIATMAGVRVKGSDAITAVLVYRIISLKGAVSLWAVVYGTIKRHRRSLRRAEPPFVVE